MATWPPGVFRAWVWEGAAPEEATGTWIVSAPHELEGTYEWFPEQQVGRFSHRQTFELTTAVGGTAGTLVTEAASTFAKSFGRAFNRRLTPLVEWIDSHDGSYWRLTFEIPSSFFKNISKLFAIEKAAYDELEQSHPQFIGFFAVRYQPRR